MSLPAARDRIRAEKTRAEHELAQLLAPQAPAGTGAPAHMPTHQSRTRNGQPLLRDQVLTLLHNHPKIEFTSGQIRQHLGCPKNTLTQAMATLAADGLVRRVTTQGPSPVWRLVEIDPTEGVPRLERHLQLLTELEQDLADVRYAIRPQTPRTQPRPSESAPPPIGPIRNGTTLKDRILTYLHNTGPASRRKIAGALIENYRETCTALATLHAEGKVRVTSDQDDAYEAAA